MRAKFSELALIFAALSVTTTLRQTSSTKMLDARSRTGSAGRTIAGAAMEEILSVCRWVHVTRTQRNTSHQLIGRFQTTIKRRVCAPGQFTRYLIAPPGKRSMFCLANIHPGYSGGNLPA